MKMSEEHECKILRELLEIYRTQSCLWDTKSLDYKCTKKRNMSWGILLGKYREIDPDADISAVKRKIDSMRGCYQRELRKVNKSILEGNSKGDIHEPALWYYKLLSFLTKSEHSLDPNHCMGNDEQRDDDYDYDDQQNEGVYMLIVDDNYEPPKRPTPAKPKVPEVKPKVSEVKPKVSEVKPKVSEVKPKVSEVKPKVELSSDKQQEITHYTKELKQSIKNTPKGDQEVARIHKINPFAVYVGKQLDEMSSFQRKVAEKVISEVIFLGKTESLTLDSRVISGPRSPNIAPCPARCVTKEDSPKPKQNESAKKRKLSQNFTPVKLPKTVPISRPQRKSTQQTQFIEVEVEEYPTLLLPRPSTDPLSSTDCSSDLDSSVSDVPHRDDDTSNSSDSDASNKDDTSIKEEDSILMTLLKTK